MSEMGLYAVNVAAALFVAVLSGLGVGSGGLFVIWLTTIGVGATQARGMNLLFFVFSASAALLVHLKSGRRIDLRLAAYLAALSLVGTALGAALGGRLEGEALRKVFGVILVLSGCYTLLGKRKF